MDLPTPAVLFLIAVGAFALIAIGYVLNTMYQSSKESREYFRRQNEKRDPDT